MALLVGCGLLVWAAIVGVGAWLDIEQLDPWKDLFGIQSGRLLRFYTTITLLTCAQLSYLILWHRSRSRKDFSGRYRVWFWVAAVSSVFCVATATRFHESWADSLTRHMNLVWIDATTLCWMIPATTMFLSAMHLMRRDMPLGSAGMRWGRVSRWLAIIAGVNLLVGSLVLPAKWVPLVNAALGSLWPAVLACTLLIHARFVTYVTNEASLEQPQPNRTSRWETRAKAFARHVALMASDEWSHFQEKRAASQAAKLAPQAEASEPVQPTATARPLPKPEVRTPSARQPIHLHPAQPIPPPHFPITAETESEEQAAAEDAPTDQSGALPAGYSAEQWRSLSKKERKRLQRTESAR